VTRGKIAPNIPTRIHGKAPPDDGEVFHAVPPQYAIILPQAGTGKESNKGRRFAKAGGGPG
jgi:hypothetical protein